MFLFKRTVLERGGPGEGGGGGGSAVCLEISKNIDQRFEARPGAAYIDIRELENNRLFRDHAPRSHHTIFAAQTLVSSLKTTSPVTKGFHLPNGTKNSKSNCQGGRPFFDISVTGMKSCRFTVAIDRHRPGTPRNCQCSFGFFRVVSMTFQ